ncbi:MAG: host attachment protein [Hyphomicrobiales bacterium]|nr:host attachment protein [Hyphomicrobiales bacterium]
MKPRKTWILIADSTGARIVEHRGPGSGLSALPDKIWQASPSSEFTDRPGRTFSRMGSSRHKLEARNKALIEQEKFATKIVSDLIDCLQKELFNDIILCAAPSMLGSLRKQMAGPLKSTLRAEIAKDLKDVPLQELAPHFEGVLAI